MSGKNQYPSTFNWQATDPSLTLLPLNASTQQGSIPSGNASGTMASTNSIYSQIIDISRIDNIGITIKYVGTGTGTITVQVANADAIFNALTFDPVLTQPAGSSGGYFINLTQLGAKYIMLKYVNASGSGTLTATAQFKDLN